MNQEKVLREKCRLLVREYKKLKADVEENEKCIRDLNECDSHAVDDRLMERQRALIERATSLHEQSVKILPHLGPEQGDKNVRDDDGKPALLPETEFIRKMRLLEGNCNPARRLPKYARAEENSNDKNQSNHSHEQGDKRTGARLRHRATPQYDIACKSTGSMANSLLLLFVSLTAVIVGMYGGKSLCQRLFGFASTGAVQAVAKTPEPPSMVAKWRQIKGYLHRA